MTYFTDEDLLDCINQMVGGELSQAILDDMHDNGETAATFSDFDICFCPEEKDRADLDDYVAAWREWQNSDNAGSEISLWDHLGVNDLTDLPGMFVVTDDRFRTYTTRTQFLALTGFDPDDIEVLVC